MKRLLATWMACFAFAASGQAVTPPPIAAKAFVLVDALSGQTLASASENDRVEPASLTKLMTAWLAFEAIRAGTLEVGRAVRVSEGAAKAGGARMFLTAGQSVQVGDLLRGMIVQSGNDAAMALAEAVAGSEGAFVARMNAQAARMGLTNTRFANSTGQPAPDHHSSARDLAGLAGSLIREFPEHYALYSQREFAFNGINQSNRNRLLWTDATVDGMKTGFTESAGYCLVASARRGERRLVSVLLGAQSDSARSAETQKLLNFGFQAYETRRLYKRGDAVATPNIYKGIHSTARLGFDRDIWLTLPRERFAGLKAALETPQPFLAPLAAGQKAGIMKLTRDNAPVAEFPVVALEEVPVAGFLSRGWDTLKLMFRSSP
ncbi:MAG: D-alanyl-D-alanine carboxypeptidase [Pseudomonadota bacterium]|nr:D-alanyl-D-alanine carboxypeptidase [Pseudomonadota bacterium]